MRFDCTWHTLLVDRTEKLQQMHVKVSVSLVLSISWLSYRFSHFSSLKIHVVADRAGILLLSALYDCVRQFFLYCIQRKFHYISWISFIVGSYVIPFPFYIIFCASYILYWSVSVHTSMQYKRQHNLLITKRNEQVKHGKKERITSHTMYNHLYQMHLFGSFL